MIKIRKSWLWLKKIFLMLRIVKWYVWKKYLHFAAGETNKLDNLTKDLRAVRKLRTQLEVETLRPLTPLWSWGISIEPDVKRAKVKKAQWQANPQETHKILP